MMPSRSLLSSRGSIAARAFAPSKPKDGIEKKTSTSERMSPPSKNNSAPAKASGSISLQTHYVVSIKMDRTVRRGDFESDN